jgi:DNA (cytosine-5)-methyltransferase 1
MRFIDLFAGLGGFHVALTKLGHECVFASEKDNSLRTLYEQNYGMRCHGDIRRIQVDEIPGHDILCAGFPCQPFSKAGKQLGLEDLGRGDLIYDILRILEHSRPQFFILENVPNLRKHEKEQTWRFVKRSLEALGYDVKESILSPHQFGVPQIRRRIFIVGSLGQHSLQNFQFPTPFSNITTDVKSVLDQNPVGAKKLGDKQIECLNLWQEIIDAIPEEMELPSFPIWAMEYNSTYPIDGTTPFNMTVDELGQYKGAFGQPLNGLSKADQLKALPSYAIYNENFY